MLQRNKNYYFDDIRFTIKTKISNYVGSPLCYLLLLEKCQREKSYNFDEYLPGLSQAVYQGVMSLKMTTFSESSLFF